MSEEKTRNTEKKVNAEQPKKGGGLKGCLTIFILLAILGGLVNACFGGENEVSPKQETDQKEQVNEEKTKDETPTKDEKLAKQKEFFINNTQPAIDEWTKSYDKLWNEGWQPTFEAIGNGSRDVYTAYDNMKTIKDGYRTLNVNDSIPVEGLSKVHQKAVKEAMRQLSYSASSRQMAADKAMKMFDEGNFSPSHMDKIKSDIASADSFLMDGVMKITTIKMDLGLIEEETSN